MTDQNQSEISNGDESEDNSDDTLEIVLEKPSKSKVCPLQPTESEKLIIESLEDELERRLEEKAAKTNLNATHVKKIIRHVVTNEHVLAMVRKAENPSEFEESLPEFEPKLTRAKAKELLSTVPIPPVPWVTPKHESEVQVLFSEDLQEDSSGDEYVPVEETDEVEEQSEDDREGSIISGPPSVPPPTPPSDCPNSELQTCWTDDGVFKIPPAKSKENNEEDANISKRTRSKLCLSSTPLEVIEEKFIPPDLFTDMEQIECDNDDWADFLKNFTKPLDEIVKSTEDEEQDPEYNILADEELDHKPDKEELRVDKAVKVTRKELNNLIAELFESVEFGFDEPPDVDLNNKDQIGDELSDQQPEFVETDVTENANNKMLSAAEGSMVILGDTKNDIEEEQQDIIIETNQIPLLEQQMRQHVQLLTQNFILTYQHPELHHYAAQMKEYLLNLKYLCEGKKRSIFYTVNLVNAIKLVEYWEELLASNTDEVKKMKMHIEETMEKSIQRKKTGTEYIVTFPSLIMETISKSDVFLYPSLIPLIPFKTPKLFQGYKLSYTESEDYLIASGLEQFASLATADMPNSRKPEGLKTNIVCSYIQEYIMPYKEARRMNYHIQMCKHSRCASNPIKYYFLFKKAPPVVHYVVSLNQLQVLPPCKRLPGELPYQWKNFIYPPSPPTNAPTAPPILLVIPQIPLSIPQIPQAAEVFSAVYYATAPVVPKGIVPPTQISKKKVKSRKKRKVDTTKQPPHRIHVQCPKKHDPLTQFVKCLSRPSQISDLLGLFSLEVEPTNKSIMENEYLKTPVEEEQLNEETIVETNCPPALKEGELLIITKKENNFDVSESESEIQCTSLPSMPNLGTPAKMLVETEILPSQFESEGATSTSSTGLKAKNILPEISTISSNSFQQANLNTEVEFCEKTDNVDLKNTGCNVIVTCSSSDNNLPPSVFSDDKSLTTTSSVSSSSQSDNEGSIQKDNVDDVTALKKPSSTGKPTPKKEPSGAEKKKAKLRREFLQNLSVSTPEDPEVERQKNEMFALAYYDKIRETLELGDYHKIMQILNDHEEGDAVELYKKVEKVLRPKYDKLADEFLLFLREKEAAAVNQLVPWIRMNNRSKFLRKLEIYFKDQPFQLRKIYKCLTELSQTVNVSMEKIKSTLLPMFKGNAVLSDLFMENFLNERPPPSLLEGPYEVIDISKEMSKPDNEEPYETMVLPNVEDKYGGPTCICSCHQIEDPEFKSRFRHCIRCGTKFLNGKVYIQSGRGLRPATVSFLTSPETDHSSRLMGKLSNIASQRKKKSDASSSKRVTLSPTKENADEESDDYIDGKKKSKKKTPRKRKKQPDTTMKHSKELQKNTPRKRASPSKSYSTKSPSPTRKEYKSSRKRSSSVKKSKDDTDLDKMDVEEGVERLTKPGSTEGQQKRCADDSIEWEDLNEAIVESSNLKPNSPDQQTAESESEFCEESSQDNCESDSNSSISSKNNYSQSDTNIEEWTREEDKIILENFQKENDKEKAFKNISYQLKDRSVSQIRSRFGTLMKLLLETMWTKLDNPTS